MSPNLTLLCTVRACHAPLERREKSLVCPNGHVFDLARRGYINLLQPQERRSRHPGDSAAGIEARRRVHDLGATEALLQGMAEIIGTLQGGTAEAVVDAGCGEGFYLGKLGDQLGFSGHGVDISLPAIDSAARRYPSCQWIVANADRFMPFANASFSLVLSITGRMNPAEFSRILHPGGHLLVAVAAPDDLIELRGAGRDRTGSTLQTFASEFDLIGQRRLTSVSVLDAEAVQDVLLSVYRPLQAKQPVAMSVTFSLDLLLFRPKRNQ